jgi:hypothetical protein
MPAQPVVQLRRNVYVYDTFDIPWSTTGRPNLHQKTVRADAAKGHYLGLIGFDPMTRTGLHQHQGTAISYFLDGSLYDFQGFAHMGQAGINLKGATHDAIAYNRCVLASRLEGPVLYPSTESVTDAVHTGARHAQIVNEAPEVMPDINITVDALPSLTTQLAGVTRRLIFDYRATDTDRRMTQLQLLPGAALPVHRTSAVVEWFLLGGDATINGSHATGGSFVIIEPDTEVEISTFYGARLLAWSDGPIQWNDTARRSDLYGF